MKIKNGYVTQNGCWISYKTRHFSHRLDIHQKLKEELTDFLTANYYEFQDDSAEVHFANNSGYRLHCVTIKVLGQVESLPFEGDAIN